MNTKAWLLTDELAKRRCIRALEKATLRDAAGQPLVVKVKRKSRRRSLPQNRLMWAWNTIVARYVGCDPEDLHEDFKEELCEKVEHVSRLTGEIRQIPRGTSTFSTVEMKDYLDRLEALVRRHYGFKLPPPDDPEAWEAWEEVEETAMRNAA